MTKNKTADDDLDPQSLAFAESLYAEFLKRPDAVPDDWRTYFESAGANGRGAFLPAADVAFPRHSLFRNGTGAGSVIAAQAPAGLDDALLQERVGRLIHAFRVRGHIIARVDPLGTRHETPPELELAFYGLTDADLDRQVAVSLRDGGQSETLRQVLQQMRNTYCRFIGAQFMHIDELSVRKWLQQRMEKSQNRLTLSREEQLRILRRLTDAIIFEEFVQKKYVGAKSFSLEGAESLIPLLDLVIERSAEEGVEEIVIGMAHRGRLNVLANVLGKRPREIFREFEDANAEIQAGHGDVKYHLGFSSDWKSSSGRSVHLSLCFNPSHLEFVNPVALGRMRAKQDRFGDAERRRGTALLIHGDASFAGEGVVQETLNLSGLAPYTVGGTIHVIVNNQIGFTTPPAEGRSSTYATDVAKMLQIPIFHVNGEDPEAVAQVVRLALEFRREFQRDVVIDMYCYRRRGHNEGDEPALTQPVMYRQIEMNDSVRDNYLERLLLLGEIGVDEAEQISEQCRGALEKELELARSRDYVAQIEVPAGLWAGFTGGPAANADQVQTGVPAERLAALLAAQIEPPPDFHPHSKIARWLKLREEMAEGRRDLDWAAGEALALASLTVEGHRIRLTGQDSARGTFSHRHAILFDLVDNHSWMPLAHLAPDHAPSQGPVEICNSPLSEAGVLGFEYGYSLDCPDGLVMWEAQYGDFCNVAQVIIDQFIVSAEDKWRRLSGIVLLLPHGLEGQGAEHSSARLERFLALAAADNIQVACPTTPAQYFHLLRRQVLRRWRKPLVVMTPKSLLRHASAVSPLVDCAAGSFQTVIGDDRLAAGARIGHILLCSGKVYYDLVRRRDELKRDDVAVVRIEQLYPFPEAALRDVLAPFRDGTRTIWVQEEPENMGAWQFLRMRAGEKLFDRLPLSGIARPASASPATGSAASFKREQERLLSAALGT
ncbi:MAG: 2-oxoglutarate dehydrogenase E1 component [Planctomycetia bacterium]|nr:2-oxoglutarate dehydrogenase E1 component [Planctomycetia bacterium]